LRLIGALLFAWVIAWIGFPQTCGGQQAPPSPEAEARQLFAEYLRAYRVRYPETATEQPVTALFDNSRIAYARWARRERDFLSRLLKVAGRIDPDSPQAVTLALLRERLEASHAFDVCHRELWNVSPITGWFSEYRRYAAQGAVGNQAQRAAALKRWGQFPKFVDTEIDNLRFGQRHGFFAPRMLVSATIAHWMP
jgi:uncharacterized protein (DUF885 family)